MARPRSERLSHVCYCRWLRLGRPAVLPPARHSREGSPGRSRLARIEDYAELRSWGETPDMAAVRLGVSKRTIERYEADLRRVTPVPAARYRAAS